MTLRTRHQAIKAVRGYQARERKRLGYEFALLGNNSGTVEVPGQPGIIYIRLHSSPDQVVRALASTSTPCADEDYGVTVKVEKTKPYAGVTYKVTGFADDLNPGDPRATMTGRHAAQHEYADFNAGGADPVNIHPDAIQPLRAQPTSPPSWALDVLWGVYQKPDGSHGIFAGGTSPNFSPVTLTTRRCDLLYLDSDGTTLAILQGTPTTDGSTPSRPTTPTNCTPICWVYLDSSLTSLSSFANILSARAFVGSSASYTAHAAVTLSTDADTVLSLTDQEIGLDTQAANAVFAGPASGTSAVPTFRALVAADIPAEAVTTPKRWRIWAGV